MSRRSFIKNTGLAGILAAGTAPAIAQTPTVKWRCASSFPKSLDTIYGAAEIFAKVVAEMTDGKFQIQRVRRRRNRARPAGGRRRPERHRRDAATRRPTTTVGKDPTFAFGTAVPFGLNARQQNAWLYQGGGQRADERVLHELQHLRASRAATPARRWAAGSARRSRRSTTSRASRCASAASPAQVMTKLGVVPQQIAGGDIYPALEKGTIDAAEWVGPYDDEKLGFYKVAKYYYYPGWWEGGAGAALLHQHDEVERAAEELPGDRCAPAAPKANTG